MYVLLPKYARKLKSEYCIFVQKSVTLYVMGLFTSYFIIDVLSAFTLGGGYLPDNQRINSL